MQNLMRIFRSLLLLIVLCTLVSYALAARAGLAEALGVGQQPLLTPLYFFYVP